MRDTRSLEGYTIPEDEDCADSVSCVFSPRRALHLVVSIEQVDIKTASEVNLCVDITADANHKEANK